MNFADPNLIGLIESAALSLRCGGDPRVAIERLDLAMRMLANVDPGAVAERAADPASRAYAACGTSAAQAAFPRQKRGSSRTGAAMRWRTRGPRFRQTLQPNPRAE